MSTFDNFVQCRVASPIAASATSLELHAAVAPYNLPPATGGVLVLTDSPGNPSKIEVIRYASRSALGLYGVERGQEGTTAIEWTGPVYCYQALMAGDFKAILDDKVDKTAGKALSENDFTSALLDKLDNIQAKATRNRLDTENADKVHGHSISDVTGLSSALSNKVDKDTGYSLLPDTEITRLATMATGATKNRADSENADKVHTHTTAQVAGLDTALDGKASNTDPRLTDAREWSEATVPQAEAEAGTDSTRRAWTAQRVRQAILGWWNSVTSSLGRNFIAAANEQAARNVLQLGTSATRDVGTSSGQLMEVGVGGLLIGDITNWDNFATVALNQGVRTELGSGTNLNNPYGIYNTTGRAHHFAFGNSSYQAGLFCDGDDGTENIKLTFYAYGSGNRRRFAVISHSGNLAQSTGQSPMYPMSQKAVTDAINGVSDRRDKLDITPNGVGLELIEKLEPVSFRLNKRDWYRKQAATSIETRTDEDGAQAEVEKIDPDVVAKPLTDYDINDGTLARDDKYTGLIAQDVKVALEDLGLGNLAIIKNYSDEYEGGDDRHYIEYNGLIPVMINAIKELSTRVKEMEDKD